MLLNKVIHTYSSGFRLHSCGIDLHSSGFRSHSGGFQWIPAESGHSCRNGRGSDKYCVFIILSLLEDSLSRSKYLKVPHTGAQTNQFKAAMEERNSWIILNGQPDAVQHACDRCMRIFSMPDGTFREFNLI